MPLELNYSNICGQESMLKDDVRCEAFRNAIYEVVRPDSVVLDIGAGTGLLSIFAAQAGAKKVYAVERTDIAGLATRIIDENGFSDRIHVIQGDIDTTELPEKVDIIVSEWLGGYALDENLLPIIVRARDRWLKPGGVMIPKAVSTFIAPAYDAFHQEDIDFWCSYPYGVDLGAIGAIRERESYAARNDLTQNHIKFTPQKMWHIDCQTCTLKEASNTFTANCVFKNKSATIINALAAWFDADLSDNVRLCNGPNELDTHWGRSVFPIGRALDLLGGSDVKVGFVHKPIGKGESTASWEIEADGYDFKSSDATILT
jgi:precorrin-6B methylase 2